MGEERGGREVSEEEEEKCRVDYKSKMVEWWKCGKSVIETRRLVVAD